MNEFDRDPGIVPAAPPRDLPPEPAKPGPFHLNSRKGELVQLASPLGAGALGLTENQPWIDHGKEIASLASHTG
jgi:hypothetical protein